MNNLFKEKDFMSVDKEHLIKTSIIENIGWFQITNVNFEKYKSFFLLIKDCVDYFRENNIQYIKQYILSTETGLFKYSEITQFDEIMSTVSTPITKFIDELVNTLDIKIV